MTFKEFGESAEIEYKLTVTVNDDTVITLTNYSEASMLEELRKVDHAVAQKLEEQWNDLPENQVEEDD